MRTARRESRALRGFVGQRLVRLKRSAAERVRLVRITLFVASGQFRSNVVSGQGVCGEKRGLRVHPNPDLDRRLPFGEAVVVHVTPRGSGGGLKGGYSLRQTETRHLSQFRR